jgi:hypothetical protein
MHARFAVLVVVAAGALVPGARGGSVAAAGGIRRVDRPAAVAARPPSTTGQVESCNRFVQAFYDWYVKQTGSSGGIEATLKRRRADFSPDLVRALNEDLAASKKHPGEIVGLDFDPFLAAQDVAMRYVTGKVTQKGERYFVPVYGFWDGKKHARPDVTPELTYQHGKWVFVNFHYAKDPKHPENENLLAVLRALREDRKKHP